MHLDVHLTRLICMRTCSAVALQQKWILKLVRLEMHHHIIM